jgi:hypothetical protein
MTFQRKYSKILLVVGIVGLFVVGGWLTNRPMPYIGQIEAIGGSAGIDARRWMELIDSYGSLAHVPPVTGINPATRQPCEFNAPSSTARVMRGGARIGAILWALDGSPFLLVEADEEAADEVAKVAENIASRLDARFVRENAET